MVTILNKGFNGNANLVQDIVQRVVSDGLSSNSELGYSAQFSGLENSSADTGASAPSVGVPRREL